jgi:N utilization substance protein A
LQGEKIDIIQWSPDPATFIVNGLAPAEVTKVVLDEEQQKIEVVVPDDQLSLAIGRRGQNVRLASQLTQWDIMILTEEEESERRQEEFRSRSQMFIDGLDVDDVLAHLLVTEGFSSVEEVAFVPIEDLLSIEGFDEEIAEELRNRANSFLSEEETRLNGLRRELDVADDVAAIEGLSPAMLVTLGEAGIKTIDDLGDLATDELIDPGNREGEGRGILAEYGLDEDRANEIIMAARAHWFDDEEEPAGAGESAGESVEEPAATVEEI